MSIDYSLYKKLSKQAGIPEGKVTDEFMFTLDVVNLYLFENNIGVGDIQEGFVDGKSDGGIDFIFADENHMTIIQGKSSSSINKEAVINAVDKILRTVNDFSNDQYQKYNKKLRSAYLNAKDTASEDSTIKIIFATNSNLSISIREDIEKQISEDEYSGFDIGLYDKSNIEDQRLLLKMEREFVPEEKIILSETNNVLKYKDNGYIVNVNASSIKKIYQKHTGKGLFSYNLREHISNKNVDSGITNTINKEKENFWFYNNGITIACSDCDIDGFVCKLWNFSIINGAQTTTKIGESSAISDKNDFSVICKIVKASEGSLSDNDTFISNISQASNSQKPIIPKDLKANSIEQRKLQVCASTNSHPLSIQIKRGVKPTNYHKVEKWQRVKNEDVGQMILSCILQRPGTARSEKRKIFEADRLYEQIFKRTMDCDTLYDLMKLSYLYDAFKIEYSKNEDDVDLIAACRNGKHVILSIISYLIKKERGTISDAYDKNLQKDNISGTIISKYREDDFEKRLYEVFRYLVKELRALYERKATEFKLTSYSNFFKTDKNYQSIILPEIDNLFYKDEFNLDRLTKYMEIFDI